MKIPNAGAEIYTSQISLARIVSEDSQPSTSSTKGSHKSSKDS